MPDLRTRAAATRIESAELREHAGALADRARALSDVLVDLLLASDFRRTPDEVFAFRAGQVRSALALMRRRLRRWLEGNGVSPQDAADITLACSEACANAIEHAVEPKRHAFEVEGRSTPDGIELRVRDFGGWRPPESERNGGRGLGMIRRLMDTTEIESGDHGTTIVMRRARRPAA